MRRKAAKSPGATSVQVFELIMDNSEDQDELNRRLRKPGEPALGASPNGSSTTHRQAATTTKRRRK